MMTARKPIAITPGDPAGIGPDILLALANKEPDLPIIAIADKDLLNERAAQLQLKNRLTVLHVPLNQKVVAGKPDSRNADYVIQTLNIATERCLDGKASALVTGPVAKHVINKAGIPFTGHTQFLADKTKTPRTVMMLMTDVLKVALVTTHIPLSKITEHITQQAITDTIKILTQDLRARFQLDNPRILVCGLNPHAGEDGHLGTEEQTILKPALQTLRAQGYNVSDPVSADTAFIPTSLAATDVVLAMYHDQGLPALKQQGFGEAINVTLGLPIIRTSVDHGTAFDLAGTGKADDTSLKNALRCAMQLAERHV